MRNDRHRDRPAILVGRGPVGRSYAKAVSCLVITMLAFTMFPVLTTSRFAAAGAAVPAVRAASAVDGGTAGTSAHSVAASDRTRRGQRDDLQSIPAESASVTTSREVEGTADFEVGYSYTQQSHLAQGGQPSAVASAKHLLASMGTFQNVSLMGWGTQDPEPTPGTYHWGSLDSRVEVMADTVPASRRMITLCTAPGWMKVGGSSQEWNMESAVAQPHYEDFAHLAAEVALRYDGRHRSRDGKLLPKVDFFDVWNEMKGFWNTTTNSWNAEAYTTLYNDVYAAIMAVRPDAEVGGPYAPLDARDPSTTADPSHVRGSFGDVDQRDLDVITYWLAHKTGAQFVSMDGGPSLSVESGFASGQYFVAVANWLRTLDSTAYPGANSLPIVWAEFYPGIDSTSGAAAGQEAVAIDVSNIVAAGQAGMNYLLIWEMEGTAQGTSPSTGESVWTDTADAHGGHSTALYAALVELAHLFPPGTNLYRSTIKGPVTALAGTNGILVVNESSQDLAVTVNGTKRTLEPYAVTVMH